MNDKRLVVNPDGSAYVEQTTQTPVAGVPALLKELTANASLRLPMLSPDLWLVYSNGSFAMFKLINRLALRCIWSVEERPDAKGRLSPVLYPSFGVADSPAGVHTDVYSWTVPPDMVLLFVATNLRSGGPVMEHRLPGAKYRPNTASHDGHCGLIGLDTRDGALYRLPLPNVYENGRLCTGPLSSFDGYPLTQAEGMFGSWEANEWNRDLIDRTEHKYKRLIQLDPKTGETLEPQGGDWRTHCFKVSTSGWIPDALLNAGLEGLI